MQAGGRRFETGRLHFRKSLVLSFPSVSLSGGRRCPVGVGGELRGNIAGNTGLPDRLLGVEPRLVLELVDDMAVARQGEARIVPELEGDVDDAAALVKQQAGEGVTQHVGRRVGDVGARDRAVERPASPRRVGVARLEVLGAERDAAAVVEP